MCVYSRKRSMTFNSICSNIPREEEEEEKINAKRFRIKFFHPLKHFTKFFSTLPTVLYFTLDRTLMIFPPFYAFTKKKLCKIEKFHSSLFDSFPHNFKLLVISAPFPKRCIIQIIAFYYFFFVYELCHVDIL